MCSARACAAAEAEIVVVAADAGDADTANANGDADVTGSAVCAICGTVARSSVKAIVASEVR